MAFALDCLPESEDDGLEEHAFALVRQQTILVLMEQAIDVLMEVDAQQEAEEEAMADLVRRATAKLDAGPPMTAEHLSTELGLGLEAVEDALDVAVARGELRQKTHYRIGAVSSEVEESAQGE